MYEFFMVTGHGDFFQSTLTVGVAEHDENQITFEMAGSSSAVWIDISREKFEEMIATYQALTKPNADRTNG